MIIRKSPYQKIHILKVKFGVTAAAAAAAATTAAAIILNQLQTIIMIFCQIDRENNFVIILNNMQADKFQFTAAAATVSAATAVANTVKFVADY